MGGDLLGSCVYGPDILARAASQTALPFVGIATIAMLTLLAYCYTRMTAAFPGGGGGYTAAKETLGTPLALVSAMALLVDAVLNVAVSLVTCVNALAEAWPVLREWRIALAMAFMALLTIANLRGVKESIGVLVPILLLFVVSHLVALAPGLIGAPPLPETAPHEQWSLFRTFAASGAIYTGVESLSNGVPVLREPKMQTARRAMLLIAGIPALLIAAELAGYFAYGVHGQSPQTLNAVLFGRIAKQTGMPASLVVMLPLTAEAALLLLAAQTGFVDGPRVLAALSADGFLPRRLKRLSGRLVPAAGLAVVSIAASGALLLAGGRLAPLVVIFVTSVFITFTLTQLAMMRVCQRARTWVHGAVHAVTCTLCLVILLGTIASSPVLSLVCLGLVGSGVATTLMIRRRYRQRDATTVLMPQPQRQPLAVLLLDDNVQSARAALGWFKRLGIVEVVIAGVALIDAVAVQAEDKLNALENRRKRVLDELALEARRLGLQAGVELRKGADVVDTAVELIVGIMRGRPPPSFVVAFRSAVDALAIDPLLNDDMPLRLQARLAAEHIAMVVVALPA